MTHDEPRIPGWDIQNLLGEGGMGRVYVAHRATDGLRAALKVIRPRAGGAVPDAYRRRFLRETQVMRGLSHPGLPAFVDAGVTDEGLPWLAVELLAGTTLEDAPGFGCMKPEVLVPRLRDLLTALAYLHGRGLIHRDLKPANVFLAGERTVLLDLGLVFVEEGTRLTATGDIAGTLSTMSPEQLRGDPATGATDLYQLGATAWLALHDAPPRESDALIALASLVPPPLPLVAATGHPGLDAFLTACLEALPADRPPSATAAAALLALDHTQETVPPARSTMGRGSRAPRAALARTSTVRARPVAAAAPPAARPLRRLLPPLVTLLVLGTMVLPRLLAPSLPPPPPVSAAPSTGPAPATPAQTAMGEVDRLWEGFLDRHQGWTALDEELLSRGLIPPEPDPSLEQALDLLEPLTGSSPGVPRPAFYATLVRVLQAVRTRRAHRILTAIMLPMMDELPRDEPATHELFADACALATASAREWRTKGIIRPVAEFEPITARLAATDPAPSWAALFRVFQAACLHFRNDPRRVEELRAILDAIDPSSLPPAHRWRHPWVAGRDAARFDQVERSRSLNALGAALAPSATVRLYFERRAMESTVEVMFGKPKGLSRNEEP